MQSFLLHHDPASPQVRDRDGLKEAVRAFRTGCPDLHIAVEGRIWISMILLSYI